MEKIRLIAEIGMNHEGSIGQAKAMIKAAKESGADAVKFQMHISKEETLHNAPSPSYFTKEGRYEYFERTAFTIDGWEEVRDTCRVNDIEFIVSPFSIEAAKRLIDIGVDTIKIPSGEVTNTPLINYISNYSIPTILSTGMSDWSEIEEAYDILSKKTKVDVLQCTSEYPCPPTNLGINVIQELIKRFPNSKIGISDHSDNIWSSIIAACNGAKIVERHFTLSKKMYGPDAYMSLEPSELSELRKALDYTIMAMNTKVNKNSIEQYKTMRETFQKSIVAKEDIPQGTVLSEDMLAYKKPGTGILAKNYKEVIGKRTICHIQQDSMIQEEDLI